MRGALLAAAVLLAAVGCTEMAADRERASTSEPSPVTTESSPQRTATPTETVQPQVLVVELDLAANVAAAAAYAEGEGLTVGITILDRQTGEEFSNGPTAAQPVWSASLAKLFVADNLLARNRSGQLTLSAADRSLMEQMLRSSDDLAADTLYFAYGAESMVAEVSERYGLPGIIPSTDPGEWEVTSVTAQSVVRFYDRFLDTAPGPDREYLANQLRGLQPIAADGFDQFFGIPAVFPEDSWAIKQGWMCCPRETSFLHTTGILGAGDRYAVAVLSQRPADASGGYSTSVLTRIAELLFPPGTDLG